MNIIKRDDINSLSYAENNNDCKTIIIIICLVVVFFIASAVYIYYQNFYKKEEGIQCNFCFYYSKNDIQQDEIMSERSFYAASMKNSKASSTIGDRSMNSLTSTLNHNLKKNKKSKDKKKSYENSTLANEEETYTFSNSSNYMVDEDSSIDNHQDISEATSVSTYTSKKKHSKTNSNNNIDTDTDIEKSSYDEADQKHKIREKLNEIPQKEGDEKNKINSFPYCRVIYDFIPKEPDEIELHFGDVVDIGCIYENGYAWVKNLRTNEEGLIKVNLLSTDLYNMESTKNEILENLIKISKAKKKATATTAKLAKSAGHENTEKTTTSIKKKSKYNTRHRSSNSYNKSLQNQMQPQSQQNNIKTKSKDRFSLRNKKRKSKKHENINTNNKEDQSEQENKSYNSYSHKEKVLRKVADREWAKEVRETILEMEGALAKEDQLIEQYDLENQTSQVVDSSMNSSSENSDLDRTIDNKSYVIDITETEYISDVSFEISQISNNEKNRN